MSDDAFGGYRGMWADAEVELKGLREANARLRDQNVRMAEMLGMVPERIRRDIMRQILGCP